MLLIPINVLMKTDLNKHPVESWGSEHPDWTKSEWQTDVALDNTVLGYWDWVEHNLTVAASEAVDGN